MESNEAGFADLGSTGPKEQPSPFEQSSPLSNAEQVKNKIAQLQEMLAEAAPGYESMLHTIHVALHKDEEVVHLLTEEEIGVIVSGLAKKKNIVIATAAAKSGTTRGGKSLKNLNLDDFS